MPRILCIIYQAFQSFYFFTFHLQDLSTILSILGHLITSTTNYFTLGHLYNILHYFSNHFCKINCLGFMKLVKYG